MNKLLSILLCVVFLALSLASCTQNCEHTYDDYKQDASGHWREYTCTHEAPDNKESHIDADGNFVCDVCKYAMAEVAQIVVDYEKSLLEKIEKLQEDHPENNYYYHPVDQIHCVYILNSNASADELVAKYDMENLFDEAKVSALNAVKMISIIFKRDDFSENMDKKLKQISEDEPLIENLFVDMERCWVESYMPKIEQYADNYTALSYEVAPSIIKPQDKNGLIIKTKEEYDSYIDELLENILYNELKETILAQGSVYDEAFFEENDLIITDTITRSSGSIKLTVNNLYLSGNKVYVVVRTDIPGVCTDDMQFAYFAFKVSKKDIANVSEVITLE